MIIIVVRTFILYIVVTAALRIMGKRQIGELQPSELVVAIMISDLAAVPMQTIDIPLLSGVIPVFTLVIAEIAMSFITMKSKTMRKFITGQPSIIIYNGHINEKEMEHLRFNINDLLEELRMNNYPNIADIEVAVLETNGQISIIPKAEARMVTIRDLNIKNAQKEGLPFMLISDGELNEKELRRSGKSREWLEGELKKKNAKSVEDVFIASLDINGSLFVQLKEKRK
ncbi:MAG: DUF421 domain-containing protein [Clostridia bacterium]|nr:DUF421 domain-containing protein [Clostridia bacterium]